MMKLNVQRLLWAVAILTFLVGTWLIYANNEATGGASGLPPGYTLDPMPGGRALNDWPGVRQAQSADGVIHEFPAGTPDEVIDKVMKDYASNQLRRESFLKWGVVFATILPVYAAWRTARWITIRAFKVLLIAVSELSTAWHSGKTDKRS